MLGGTPRFTARLLLAKWAHLPGNATTKSERTRAAEGPAKRSTEEGKGLSIKVVGILVSTEKIANRDWSRGPTGGKLRGRKLPSGGRVFCSDERSSNAGKHVLARNEI